MPKGITSPIDMSSQNKGEETTYVDGRYASKSLPRGLSFGISATASTATQVFKKQIDKEDDYNYTRKPDQKIEQSKFEKRKADRRGDLGQQDLIKVNKADRGISQELFDIFEKRKK